MEGKIHPINPRARQLADKLRGELQYGKHYEYLLDWYMNDRRNWDIHGRECIDGIVVADDHIKASLVDVLDSLKHLEGKVKQLNTKKRQTTITDILPETRVARKGNIFTRLVDSRRFGE